MAKKTSEKDFADILSVLGGHPDGASLKALLENSQIEESRSTLIRRLDTLIQLGKIHKKGERRSARYFLTFLAPEIKDFTPEVTLSQSGREIQSLIKRPLSQRIPVNYNINFLDSYIPNQTYYLPKEIRDDLRTIGTQPEGNQPAGTFARQILNNLLIDLSWNSSRLEGNTYSLLETKRLLELGESATGKSSIEARMILNHKEAIEFLLESSEFINFDGYTICNLHALLSEGLLSNKNACGRLRSIQVGISGTTYSPLQIPQQINEMFDSILSKTSEIQDPFEQAFFLMVHLPYLQPFEDVNKRVSRLAANISFIKSNLCPLSFVGVPENLYVEGILGVYELNRVDLLKDVFIWAYQRSALKYSSIRHTIGEPDPFESRYRLQIKQLVGSIVKNKYNQPKAIREIQKWSEVHIASDDQAKFKEKVESELISLHIGNIARFKILPKEFESWKTIWN